MSNIYEFNVNGDIYGLNVPSVSRTVSSDQIILNAAGDTTVLDPYCINMISFTQSGVRWVGFREFSQGNIDSSKSITFSMFGLLINTGNSFRLYGGRLTMSSNAPGGTSMNYLKLHLSTSYAQSATGSVQTGTEIVSIGEGTSVNLYF